MPALAPTHSVTFSKAGALPLFGGCFEYLDACQRTLSTTLCSESTRELLQYTSQGKLKSQKLFTKAAVTLARVLKSSDQEADGLSLQT